MRIIIVAIAFSLLVGCVGSSNNLIGVGWVEERKYEAECVTSVFSSINDLEITSTSDNYFSFVVNRYKGTLMYKEVVPSRFGYQLNLDGMFLGESSETFAIRSKKIQDEIVPNLKERCAHVGG